MRANCKPFTLLLTLASLSQPALAILPHAPTAAELSMLPEGCQVKLQEPTSKNVALSQSWSDRVGRETWLHMHHFCGGLKFMNRARFAFNKDDMRVYLQNAITEFDYVIKHWPANSPLMPEAKSQRAQAVIMLNQHH